MPTWTPAIAIQTFLSKVMAVHGSEGGGGQSGGGRAEGHQAGLGHNLVCGGNATGQASGKGVERVFQAGNSGYVQEGIQGEFECQQKKSDKRERRRVCYLLHGSPQDGDDFCIFPLIVLFVVAVVL